MQHTNNKSYCCYCGNIIDSDSKYCVYCGAKVSYENTPHNKARSTALKLFKIVLGTIMAGLLSLIPFFIAYQLFPDTLCDYGEWMWNFSFTGGVAFLLGCLLCIPKKIKKRNVVYFIISLLIMVWGIMIYVRYYQKFGTLNNEKNIENIHTPSFDDSWSNDTLNKENNILPTQEEIDETNAILPVKVVEGVMFSRVAYDETTMTQTFYYDFTQEIEESAITTEFINQRKALLLQVLKEQGNTERLEAGVTYLYIYRSVDGRVLYKIHLDSEDL